MKVKIIFIFLSPLLFLLSITAQVDEIRVQYVYPKPGSTMISVESGIILRLDGHDFISRENAIISAKGEISGSIKGKEILSDDRKTLIFKPENPFTPGEEIRVRLNLASLGTRDSVYTFFVSKTGADKKRIREYQELRMKQEEEYLLPLQKNYEESGSKKFTVINGVSIPSSFPVFEPWISEQTAPGYLFLNNWGGNHYIMILKNDGTPFYYKKVNDHSRDFKVQNGILTRRVYENLHGFVSMDHNFNQIREYTCQNGYGTDEHDLLLTPEGHAIMIALDIQTIDMSALVDGGNKNASVIGNHIQEIDQNNNVVFEWRSWDHFNITDAVHENLKASSIDYVHMNSVGLDYDGNIVISSRHLSECTKINRTTGEIIWRLGGKNNQFSYLNVEEQNSYQHDFRPVPGKPDHYTMFDNGNYHATSYSRGIEFKLDTLAMTAEKVWEYRHKPNDYATGWMGNCQRLPNGNTFINWADGSLPKATEVTPEGDVVYEGNFTDYYHCYRAFRFEWDGKLAEPYLMLEGYRSWITLIFNQFGETDIDHYNIYGGTVINPTELLASTSATWYNLTELENKVRYYFRVTSVSGAGVESDYSNNESIFVNFVEPGENLIRNGDFMIGDLNWSLDVNSGAVASAIITATGEYHFSISEGGTSPWNIQLVQGDLQLIQGYEYTFEFDAYAEIARTIEAKITKASDPWNNYGSINPTYISTRKQHYIYTFTMNDPSDMSARVVFNTGTSSHDVFIDNASLKISSLTDAAKDLPAKELPDVKCFYHSEDNSLHIDADVPFSADIKLEIYSINGSRLMDVLLPAGQGYNQKNVAFKNTSGTYLSRISILKKEGNQQYIYTHKFIIP